MSYDEEQHKERRVVVETPLERREVVQHQVVRTPERRGFSGGAVAAIALTAIAVTAIIFLFLATRGEKDDSVNVRVAQQPTPARAAATPLPAPTPITTATIVPVPMPVTVEVPTGQPALPATAPTPAVDSAALQRKVDDAIRNDEALKNEATLIALVEGAKVRLTGSVSSQDLKQHAETVAARVVGKANVIDELTVTP
jgi:hypothetical protein